MGNSFGKKKQTKQIQRFISISSGGVEFVDVGKKPDDDFFDKDWAAYLLKHRCDICSGVIEPNDTRYYCDACSENQHTFDLCTKCFANHEKQTGHVLTKLEQSAVAPIMKNGSCMAETLIERRLFGTKNPNYDPNSNNADDFSNWVSYERVFTRAKKICMALRKLGIQPNSFVGICGLNTIDWYIADYVCILNSYMSAPIHIYFDQRAIGHIIQETEMEIIFCETQQLHKVIGSLPQCPTLRHIVVFSTSYLSVKDCMTEATVSACKTYGVNVYTMDQVEEMTSDTEVSNFTLYVRSPDDVLGLVFTSGSTGIPKGTLIREFMLSRALSDNRTLPIVYSSISFGPLAHLTQRRESFVVMGNGGRIALYEHSRMDTLFEEIQKARPFQLTPAPRILNLIYSEFLQALEIEKIKRPDVKLEILTEEMMLKFRNIFGDRIRILTTGGAPTKQSIIDFMHKLLPDTVINESYGTTEGGAIAENGYKLATVEIMLEDVPELGYSKNDKPFARGLLWVKTRNSVANAQKGYFKDSTTSQENFRDGFFCTGDIVEYEEKTNKLRVIDRKKNISKLAQGEYISPEYLESLFSESPYVRMIYVHADIFQPYVLAVVVPNFNLLEEWAKTNLNQNMDKDALCTSPEIKQMLLKELARIGKEKSLNFYEIPQGIHIEKEVFTADSQLLTPTHKLSRTRCANHYKDIMNQIYEETNHKINNIQIKQKTQGQVASSSSSDANNNNNNNHSDLVSMVRNAINKGSSNASGVDTEHSLVSLGMDSMSAVNILSLIQSKTNMNIPVTVLYNENTTIQTLQEIIQQKSAAIVEDAKEINWEAETTLDSEIVSNIKELKKKDHIWNFQSPKNVLLTGATGFLGSFLLRDLLERTKSTVYCVARTKKNEQASDRIKKRMQRYKMWQQEYKSRIVALNGDISEEQFGLSDQEYATLSESVDVIYHNAAYVNGLFPYPILRSANVQGTIEILKFASQTKLKPVFYVSTLSVCAWHTAESFVDRKDALKYLSFMSGYGSSKLVSELLLEQAWENDLPIMIFRAGTISGDSVNGCSNINDFLGKYIKGIFQLKAAPDINKIMDLAPVDWVSSAIVKIASNEKNAGKVYHVFNKSKSLTVNEMTDFLNMSLYVETTASAEQQVKIMAFPAWRELLKQHKENALYPILSYFDHRFPVGDTVYPQENTVKALEGTGIAVPSITQRIVHLYLYDLLHSPL